MSIKVGQYQWRVYRGPKNIMYTVEKRRWSCKSNSRWKYFWSGEKYDYHWVDLGVEEEYIVPQALEARGYHPRRTTKTFGTIAEALTYIDEQIENQSMDNTYRGSWQP